MDGLASPVGLAPDVSQRTGFIFFSPINAWLPAYIIWNPEALPPLPAGLASIPPSLPSTLSPGPSPFEEAVAPLLGLVKYRLAE